MAKTKKKPDENMHGVAMLPSATNTQPNADGDKPNRKPFDLENKLGLAGQIAGSMVYWGNAKFPNADKHFPHQPHLRSVGRFFPWYQEDGKSVGLYVEECSNDDDVKEALLKKAAVLAEGCRFVYIDKRDMQIGDLRAQLMEQQKRSA